MLTTTMTPGEIYKEITLDWQDIQGSVQHRVQKYQRDRLIRKIDKNHKWQRTYVLKSARGNNWMIFLSKHPSAARYKNALQTAIGGSCYTNTPLGVEAYFVGRKGKIVHFTAHCARRYRERMNISGAPLEILQRMIGNNLALIGDDAQEVVMFKCNEGLMVGKKIHHNHISIRTFISNELLNDTKRAIIEKIEQDIVDGDLTVFKDTFEL